MSPPQHNRSSEAEWNLAASAYGSNIGRTSAYAASRLVWFASELTTIDASSKVLDVGAGSGAVTMDVLRTTKARVTASDLHQSMLDSIVAPLGRHLIRQLADVRHLTKVFEKNSFSHVFCTYVLQSITTPVDALREMHQILDPEIGVIGIACWDQQNDLFDIWEKACRSIDPSYRLPITFNDPHAWRTEDELAVGLFKAGFKDVYTERLTCPFPFDGIPAFLDFWFNGKNPSSLTCINSWKGNLKDVRQAVARICKADYENGRAICTRAVLGVGRV